MNHRTVAAPQLDILAASVPSDLRELIKAGDPLVAMARQSSESPTRKAVRRLRNDAAEALSTLERTVGLSLPDILPSESELQKQLKRVEPIRSVATDGDVMEHRVVMVRSGLVVLILILGTATKLNEHRQSPVATIIADVIRDLRPSLLWAKRVDRFLRHHWGAAPMMIELKQQQSWIGDSRRGVRFPRGPEELMLFWDFHQANENASIIASASVSGMRQGTDAEFVGGRAFVAASRVAPPGFARIRLREGAGIGRSVWILDTPSAIAEIADAAAVGLPECLTDDGDPADQVANIRWALSKVGLPGWADNRIGAELMRRGYSTDRYRIDHGSDATYGDTDLPNDRTGEMLRAIYRNLDMYETGELSIAIGDGEEVTITGLFPPSGEWATPEDFRRIRATLAARRQSTKGTAQLPFTGLRCLVDGVECVLRKSVPRGEHPEDDNHYIALRADMLPDATVRPPSRFKITADALAGLVVDAVAAAGERAVALVAEVEPDELVTEIQDALRTARRQHAVAVSDRNAVDAELSGRAGYRPSGARMQHLNDEYNRLQAQVDDLDQQITRLKRNLSERRDVLRAETTPARTRTLLHMVDSLRDPNNVTWRDVWLVALREMSFDTNQVTVGGVRGVDVTVSGLLAFGDSAEAFTTPVSGEILSDAHRIAAERAESAISLMRSGTPLLDCDVPMVKQLRSVIAARFGASVQRFPLLACQDPRTLRIAVALLADEQSPQEVAAALDEPLSLVERVHRLHTPPTRSRVWKQSPSRIAEVAYAAAAASGGTVTWTELDALTAHRKVLARTLTEGWEETDAGLRSHNLCLGCGGRRLAALVAPEPAGRVCLDCRLDAAGVIWPADPYDDFLAFPGLWRCTG